MRPIIHVQVSWNRARHSRAIDPEMGDAAFLGFLCFLCSREHYVMACILMVLRQGAAAHGGGSAE